MEASEIVTSFQPYPPSDEDLATTLKLLIRDASDSVTTTIPAIVMDYDRDTHCVKVRGLVKTLMANGNVLEPIDFWTTAWRPQCGGFVIDIPIRNGDVGWVFAADKDTTLVKQMNNRIEEENDLSQNGKNVSYGNGNQGPQKPNTYLRHCEPHGFFMPDSWAKLVVPDNLKDALVIQNVDSNANLDKVNGAKIARLALHRTGSVDLKGSDVTVDGPAAFTESVDVKENVSVGGSVVIGEDILISKDSIPWADKTRDIKFRQIRFIERTRDGRDVARTMYALSTEPSFAAYESDTSSTEVVSGGGGGTGGVKFHGTTGTTNEGSEFTFASASDSNVVVTASGTNLTIGVYYT